MRFDANPPSRPPAPPHPTPTWCTPWNRYHISNRHLDVDFPVGSPWATIDPAPSQLLYTLLRPIAPQERHESSVEVPKVVYDTVRVAARETVRAATIRGQIIPFPPSPPLIIAISPMPFAIGPVE